MGERTGRCGDSVRSVRILIATAGELSPVPVAEFIDMLPVPERVVVATVIEVPRSFLDEIRSEGWHPLTEDPGTTESDDDVISRYVEERGARITGPVVATLRTHDIEAESLFLEGEDPVITLVNAAGSMDANLIILGATKRLFDETHWESVTARVMRDSQRPVLVVPAAPKDDTGEMDLPTSEID